MSVENRNKKKIDWLGLRTTLLFLVPTFSGWLGAMLIAYDRAVLISFLIIVVLTFVVQKLRGKAFALGSLGGGIIIGGFHGFAGLAAYDGEPIGTAELVPADWTWLRLILLVLLGAGLFWYWGRRARRSNVH